MPTAPAKLLCTVCQLPSSLLREVNWRLVGDPGDPSADPPRPAVARESPVAVAAWAKAAAQGHRREDGKAYEVPGYKAFERHRNNHLGVPKRTVLEVAMRPALAAHGLERPVPAMGPPALEGSAARKARREAPSLEEGAASAEAAATDPASVLTPEQVGAAARTSGMSPDESSTLEKAYAALLATRTQDPYVEGLIAREVRDTRRIDRLLAECEETAVMVNRAIRGRVHLQEALSLGRKPKAPSLKGSDLAITLVTKPEADLLPGLLGSINQLERTRYQILTGAQPGAGQRNQQTKEAEDLTTSLKKMYADRGPEPIEGDGPDDDEGIEHATERMKTDEDEGAEVAEEPGDAAAIDVPGESVDGGEGPSAPSVGTHPDPGEDAAEEGEAPASGPTPGLELPPLVAVGGSPAAAAGARPLWTPAMRRTGG